MIAALFTLLVLVVFVIWQNYPTKKRFGLKEKEK